MSICEVCTTRTGFKATIVGEFYYKSICQPCYDLLTVDQSVSSGQAEYDRGRDTEENEAAIMQPWSGGEVSKEFIQLYPERSRQLFSQDEIDRATRS